MTEMIVGDDDGVVSGLKFKDVDEPLAVEIVVFSAGIRPRDALARECDLDVAERGGILVDEQCRTSDAASSRSASARPPAARCTAWSPPATPWPRSSSTRSSRGPGSFTGADMSTKLKLLGVDVASFGDAFAATDGALELVYSDAVAGVYKKLVISEDGTPAAGRDPRRRRSAYGVLPPARRQRHRAPGQPGGADPARVVAAASQLGMPDEAQVCSCNDVTKGQIKHAVSEEGCETVADVKKCTRAGSTCGSCVSVVKNIIEEHFESVGKVVDKGLCEHFRLSRQELFDVVAVHGYKRFDDIVESHGTGRGCDICKPAIASILASQFNGHVLDGRPRRCRTPTTTTSRTSSATAPTRSCRASPAARSRPTS